MQRRSESMKEGYAWGGWTLNPEKATNLDKLFLANYFGYKIGDKPTNVMQDTTMRGIDPISASYEEVSKLGRTTGPKPVVPGTTVHKFGRRFMGRIFDQLDRSEKNDHDDRSYFLEHTRRLSKKWLENAHKSIQGKALSKEEVQNALWSFISDR